MSDEYRGKPIDTRLAGIKTENIPTRPGAGMLRQKPRADSSDLANRPPAERAEPLAADRAGRRN